jgi:uncharacterized damage-inducible protein DinB
MSIGQMLLPEYDQEMATTRKVLERVPLDKGSWKPHEKSFSMAQLAGHVSNMTGWVAMTIATDSLDLEPPGGPKFAPPPPPTEKEAMLAEFDKNVAAGRAALAGVSDEEMTQPWSLLQGGNVMFTMPRVASIRGMILNHMIHHRGQLSVYLRLNDVPVPSIYGPSADEKGF